MRFLRTESSGQSPSPEVRSPWVGLHHLLLILGVISIGVGLWVGTKTEWWIRHFAPSYEVLATLDGAALDDTGVQGHFPLDALTRYRVGLSQGLDIRLDEVAYRDLDGTVEHAVIYPDPEQSSVVASANPRQNLWEEAAKRILDHVNPQSFYISWWDNAQRIHFLTGEATLSRQPVFEALDGFPLADFWAHVSGGYTQDPTPGRQLAQWFTMDANRAIPLIQNAFPSSNNLFVLTCVDDLARLGEIERLSGVRIPIEVRYFPAAQDLHAQIKEVRRWASELGGDTNYLVQPVDGGGVRAWRVTSEEGSNLLLIRLLPFSRSLENPLEQASLVYQSHWGGYLQVHQIKPASAVLH